MYNLNYLLENKLLGDFYNRSPIFVARDLIGKIFCKFKDNKLLAAIICETEAYLSENDEASHSYKGITKRNKSMFDDAGTLYVYKIYGVHHCINAVTESMGIGSAVLIRAAEPIDGIEIMKSNRNSDNIFNLCSGPGKITQAFDLNLDDDGKSLLDNDIFISDNTFNPTISSSQRIGITKSNDLPYRFYISNSKYLSR